MQQNQIDRAPKPNYPLRRAVAIGTAALALFGAKDVVRTVVDATHGDYTPQQLKAFPHKAVTLQPGQGADAAIAKVEPAVLDNPEQRFEVEGAIIKQGQGPNHELASGQLVEVPILPGNPNSK
jgi:hypothetical protein